MNLFCPTCESAYSGASACPKCGGRLITPAEAFALPSDPPPPPPELIRPTAAARVVVGIVAGLGLYFAGRDLAMAAVLPVEDTIAAWWAGPAGVAVGYLLRAIAAAVGGLLAGAGRPEGAVTGLVAGLTLGGIFLVLDTPPGRTLGGPPLAAFAGVAVLGAAAGLLGGRIWPAAAEPPLADAGGSRGSSLSRLAEVQQEFNNDVRPTKWVRVTAGAAIAIAGVIYADPARLQLKFALNGAWNLGNPSAVPTFDLGLAGLALSVGGMLAGAATGAGLRHGLIAGVLTAAGVLGIAPRQGEFAVQPMLALLEVLEVYPDLASGQAMGTIGGVLLASMVFAAWLGNQLLPPLAPVGMRSRKLAIS